jgi:hypothetical protein
MAIVGATSTFVNVRTDQAIARVSCVTPTSEAANGVGAETIDVAVVRA